MDNKIKMDDDVPNIMFEDEEEYEGPDFVEQLMNCLQSFLNKITKVVEDKED